MQSAKAILSQHYSRIGAIGGRSRSPRKLAALAMSRAKLAAKRATAKAQITITTPTAL